MPCCKAYANAEKALSIEIESEDFATFSIDIPSAYHWDNFIYRLVEAGYGSYQEAERADFVRSAIFLLLRDYKQMIEWIERKHAEY